MFRPNWRPRIGQPKEALAWVEVVPNGMMTHLRDQETGAVKSFFERDEDLGRGESQHEYDPLHEPGTSADD